MQIYINGEIQQIDDNGNIPALIEMLDLSGKRFAIEINEELVSRSNFEDYQLKPNDRIEIVHAIGGG